MVASAGASSLHTGLAASVAPVTGGMLMTPGRILAGANGEEAYSYTAGIPLGRRVAPEEMAQAALFPLSDRSSHGNGQALVDGGQSAGRRWASLDEGVT